MTPAAGAIDVHTHFVPATMPPHGGGGSAHWPSMDHHAPCCARVVIGGRVFREIESNCWDAARRTGDMRWMDIGVQCLSPMPELLSYWMDAADCVDLCRHINAEIAAVVCRGEGRFLGLGMVPLQDVDLAVAALRHCMEDLRLDGVEIGTNVGGRPIGDPQFAPFFAAAEALGATLFVHPLRAVGMDRLIGPPSLEQVIAFPCETALAIASLMTGGTLARHPRLKLVFSHGGGAFGQLLPRLRHAWTFLPALQDAIGEDPAVLARRLFYDTLVYDPIALRFIIDQFGSTQIVIGTDYPFAILERHPVAAVNAIGLSGRETAAILRDNALRLLTTT